MAVKIIEVCNVSPPLQTVSPISVPLTFFDLLWLKHAPVQRLFFYPTQNPEETIFSQLKQSLTLLLQHFPILSGHLKWPETCPTPIVHFENGCSLALTLARSDSDFDRLSGNYPRLAEESRPLVPVLAQELDSRIPVLAVQVTLFEAGGFCIGLTAHHAFMDGNSSTAFVKTWASFSKFGENRQPALCFDRDNRFSDLDNLSGNVWLKNIVTIRDNLSPWNFLPPPGKVRGTFELNDSKIKMLKELLCNKGVSRVSSFIAAYAYVIVCFVKSISVETQKILALVHADFRARLAPPLPMPYFGNCIRPGDAYLDLKDLMGDGGFVYATREITKGIDTILSVGIEGAERWLTIMFEKMHEITSNNTVISMAGSNRFGFYGIDFGWGRPVRVETTSVAGTGTISFSDGKDGSGIEIGLVLDKAEMETFASLFEQGLSSDIQSSTHANKTIIE